MLKFPTTIFIYLFTPVGGNTFLWCPLLPIRTFHLDALFPFDYAGMSDKGNWLNSKVHLGWASLNHSLRSPVHTVAHLSVGTSQHLCHPVHTVRTLPLVQASRPFWKKKNTVSLVCFLFLNDRWLGNIFFTLIIISPSISPSNSNYSQACSCK